MEDELQLSPAASLTLTRLFFFLRSVFWLHWAFVAVLSACGGGLLFIAVHRRLALFV